MTCRDVTGYLLEYVSGEVEADLRGEIDEHTAACGTCREYLREYRATIAASQAAVQALTSSGTAHLPGELIAVVLDSLAPSG